MTTAHIKCRIEGITPLLLHRFTDEEQQEASKGSRRSSAARDRGTPLQQATKSLYLDEKKKPIIPQEMLMACLKGAGRYFRVGQSKISTQRSSLIPAAVQILDLYFPLKHKEKWEVDTRPVRMPVSGGRILRHRPKFNDWLVDFEMDLDTQEIGLNLMREIMDAAGNKVGLGDYRPSTSGPFGRFVVTHWEVEMLDEEPDDEEEYEEDDEEYEEEDDED